MFVTRLPVLLWARTCFNRSRSSGVRVPTTTKVFGKLTEENQGVPDDIR